MLSEPEPQCGHTDMGTETRKQYKEADAAFIRSKEEGKSKEFTVSDGIQKKENKNLRHSLVLV